jgi:hypothetical protein
LSLPFIPPPKDSSFRLKSCATIARRSGEPPHFAHVVAFALHVVAFAFLVVIPEGDLLLLLFLQLLLSAFVVIPQRSEGNRRCPCLLFHRHLDRTRAPPSHDAVERDPRISLEPEISLVQSKATLADSQP